MTIFDFFLKKNLENITDNDIIWIYEIFVNEKY